MKNNIKNSINNNIKNKINNKPNNIPRNTPKNTSNMPKKIGSLLITLLLLLTIQQTASAGFSLVLNFDDGYQGVYQYAFPLLQKYNLPAVIFVPVNYIGRERHLTLTELQEIKQAGWEIGSHTMNHPDLSQLTAEGLKYEIEGSKEYLKNHDLLAGDYASFASPMTVWNSAIENLVRQNYQTARGKQFFDFRRAEQPDYELQVVIKETSLQLISSWIEKAYRRDQTLILIFHEVAPGGNIYYYPVDKFSRLVELIKDYPVNTFRELAE